jgi:hypothetical protein
MNESSTQNQPELIDRIFRRFTVLYGNKFTNLWAGIDPEDVRSGWADELARFSKASIVLAVGKLNDHPYPPTLPEFLLMCEAASQRIPAQLEPRPRLPSVVSAAMPDVVAARERFMALKKTLKRPPMTPAWSYRAYARHQSGEHLLNPEELQLVQRAMAEDRGRHAPQEQKEAA